MRTLFVLNDPPYGAERSCKALRLAGAPAKRDTHEPRVFVMGDAAACAEIGRSVPQGIYNVNRMPHVRWGKALYEKQWLCRWC